MEGRDGCCHEVGWERDGRRVKSGVVVDLSEAEAGDRQTRDETRRDV